MSQKVRWGILGTAAIAVNKVIPAMQQGDWTTRERYSNLNQSKSA